MNTAGSAPWQITLLGGLRAEHRDSGATVTRFRSQKFGALLAYLALFPQRVHTREELADLLWPDADPEVARTNLRTALSSLRKQLEPPGTPSGSVLVTPGHGQLGLNPAAFETDVAAFDKAVKAAARPGSTPESQAARVLAQAADLYRGPLLPGFYETWALSERDRLAEAYLDVLRLLVQHHEQAGDPKTALVWARRAVAADVLDEQAHASVIRLLMATGDRSGAHRQFDELTRLLDEQLGAEPSGEVRALLEARAGPIHRPSQKIAAFDTAFRAAAPSERTSGDNDTHFVESGAEAESPNTPLHLPLTLTRFFGRESETSVLAGLLREADTRLVTLTGPGGSGKTRLAIETARGLGGTFFGGIWFVPLADLHEAGRIPGAIADALCLPRSPQSAPLAQVADTLNAAGSGVRSQGGGAPVLLVLDNFEHLAGSGAPLVHTLLARVPNLTCLVTSRQRLLLDGEREFALPPLATPKTEKTGDHTPESLLAYPSVALFVSRAQAARPDFALTPRNAEAVARLCQRLEGIPLALELAAAWTQTLTPAQMLERLERRFDLLVSRRRDAPGRHATLRATIEWSWGLLPPDLQRFFAQLSVFRGGWTLEAAEAVTGDPNALLYLTELRERSLVVSAEEDLEEEPPCDPDAPVENAPVVTATTEAAAAGMRFRMLESLREFASERLNESGERAALAARHLAYFLRLAEAAGPHLRGPGQISWLRRLETDHDNLRAALDWSFRSSGDEEPGTKAGVRDLPADAGLRLAGALTWFWLLSGHLREGLRWLERAGTSQPFRPPNESGANAQAAAANLNTLWARVLPAAGWLAWRAYDGESRKSAVAYSETGLVLCRAQSDGAGAVLCLATLGLAAHHANDSARARALLEEGVAVARTLGNDAWLLGHALATLGKVLLPQGEIERARAAVEEALAAFRVAQDRYSIADTLRELSLLLFVQGQHEAAKRHTRESVALLAQLGDTGAAGLATLVLGYAANDAGDWEAARAHYEDALRLCRQAGHRYGMAHALHNRAYTFLAQKDLAAARADLAESLALFRDLGNHGDLALSLEGFARLARAGAAWERCVRLFGATDALRAAIGNPMADWDRDRRDADLAEAKRALGDARFEAAWSAGRLLAPDQAADEARVAEPAPTSGSKQNNLLSN